MWHGHFGLITVATNRIELTPENTQPIRSAPYLAVPKARKLQWIRIGKMLLREVIKPAHTERAASIVFFPIKDGSIRFCVYYRRLNAVTERYSYALSRMDE